MNSNVNQKTLLVPVEVAIWLESSDIPLSWLLAIQQLSKVSEPFESLQAFSELMRVVLPHHSETFGLLPLGHKEELIELWRMLEVASNPKSTDHIQILSPRPSAEA